ncbi:MAG: hypothetical protein JW822_03440 [Spirochaetales bacterium]|nr:hypothetical protein [Spirochaetales bacterium]
MLIYIDKVEELIVKKREHLEQKGLKQLRDGFQAYQTLFENIYNILLRKGIIQEDPYKYDEKISEVNPPSDEAFLDTDKQNKMSQRLSFYHSQIEFLNNYYQFSLDFLTLGRLKRIVKLLKYINWSRVSITSPSPTTKVLAEYFAKIRQGSDSLSAGIIGDALTQIEKVLGVIFKSLNEVISFEKEAYKIEVRKNVFTRMQINAPVKEEGLEQIMQQVKKFFAKYMPQQAFFAELIKEIIFEDYTPQGMELRNKTLEALTILEEKKQKQVGRSYKDILIQAIKFLGSCGLQLEDALNKINEGQQLLENRKRSLGERIKRWLMKLINRGVEAKLYEIEYFDVVTSTIKIEKVSYNEFIEETQKLAQICSHIINRSSNLFRRLEVSPDDKVFEFLNKNLAKLQIAHRRLNGLISFFKAEIPREDRIKLKGIKLELNSIKNSIVKSNQKKHEYVAFKEEEEQMKKLGIKKENN